MVLVAALTQHQPRPAPQVVVAPAGTSYYFRVLPRNDTRAAAALVYSLDVPVRGVRLHNDSDFGRRFAINIQYLSQFPLDDLLYWFRRRAGERSPPGQNWGWDDHGPDQPYGLRGSVAGLFMMGAGGTLRWRNDTTLGPRLAALVANISALQEDNGFAMAFPQNETKRVCSVG